MGLEADPLKVNNSLPFSTYVASANTALTMGARCKQMGNLEYEYTNWFRAASLVIETLPKHHGLRDPTCGAKNRAALAKLKTRVAELAMPRMEELKPLLKKRKGGPPPVRPSAKQICTGHAPQLDWSRFQPGPAAPRHAPADYVAPNATLDRQLSFVAHQQHAHAGPAPPLPGDASDPFAASVAYGRAGAAEQAGTLGAQNGLALPGLPTWASSVSARAASTAYVRKHALFGSVEDDSAAAAPGPRQSSGPLYPLVQGPDLGALNALGRPTKGLPAPPHVMEVHEQAVAGTPGRPSCPSCAEPHVAAAPAHAAAAGPSPVPDSAELRNLYIPPALFSEFLALANDHTKRGIEFCGVLTGKLTAPDATFALTALIVPKQKGEANVVEMTHEEELVEYQLGHELLPLGWVHTHPTQTCFLSSIDVHTQCGYQIQLPEAVSIVMAPTDPRSQIGVFRLTVPGGQDVVQRCPHRGFHPHPAPDTGQEIYEEAGRVYVDESANATFKIVDLR